HRAYVPYPPAGHLLRPLFCPAGLHRPVLGLVSATQTLQPRANRPADGRLWPDAGSGTQLMGLLGPLFSFALTDGAHLGGADAAVLCFYQHGRYAAGDGRGNDAVWLFL